MKEIILIFINWLHLGAAVIWIGGIFFMLFIAIPSAKKIPREETHTIMGYISKRFTYFANYSILILILTGIVLTVLDKNFSGMENFNNLWVQILVIKHIIILLMIIVHFYRLLVLSRKIENASSLEEKSSLQNKSFLLVKLNFTLGMTVLFLSGITLFL